MRTEKTVVSKPVVPESFVAASALPKTPNEATDDEGRRQRPVDQPGKGVVERLGQTEGRNGDQ